MHNTLETAIEFNIPSKILDPFEPTNWAIMSYDARKNSIQNLIDFIGNELHLTGKYQAVFEAQESFIDGEFDEKRTPPCIVFDSEYLTHGVDVYSFALNNTALFIKPGNRLGYGELHNKEMEFLENVKKNKAEFAQKILLDKNLGLLPMGILFRTCLHEMEHARQFEIEQIPKITCPYKKDTPEYRDFMLIHNNSIQNIYKIQNPKISFIKSNALGYLPFAKGVDGNCHTALHKLQYVERTAYHFAEVNMYKSFIPYFESKGYNTDSLLKDMKLTFDYNTIISDLETHYHCHGVQNELDKIIGDLGNVEIDENNKKLYKYVSLKLCEAAHNQKKDIKKESIKSIEYNQVSKAETNVANTIPSSIEEFYEPKTLHDLAEIATKVNGFWKFSQSESLGSKYSVEGNTYFANYNSEEGKIIYGKQISDSEYASCGSIEEGEQIIKDEKGDNYRPLSFVSGTNLGKCFLYGNQITKFVFDTQNEDFKKIENTPIQMICASSLDEIRTAKLVVEKSYSLKDIETIKMIIKMSDNDAARQFLTVKFDLDLYERLKAYGYDESASFVKFIKDHYPIVYPKDMEIIRDNIDKIELDFMFEKVKADIEASVADNSFSVQIENTDTFSQENIEISFLENSEDELDL